MATERQQSDPCPQPARSVPQGHHPTPHTRGSGCWRTAAIVSLRLCSQQGWHTQLDPQGHTQQFQPAALRHPLAGSTDGAGGALSQAAETAFLKGCTGSGQLQARIMPRGCSPAASSIWQVSLLILTSQQGTSPLSRENGSTASPPHRLVLWLEDLQLSQPVLPHQPQLLLQPRSHPAFPITQKRGGNTTFPCTTLEHNMRLQQQALQKHPWRVVSLPQMTTANSKPSEMTVRDDLGHGERAKNATGAHPFQKAAGSRATSHSLGCLQQFSSCCSCSLSPCICPQHSLLISLTDKAMGKSDKRPGSGSSELLSCQKGGGKAPCKSASRDVVSEKPHHAQRAGESPSSHPPASTAILLGCLNTWGLEGVQTSHHGNATPGATADRMTCQVPEPGLAQPLPIQAGQDH